MAYTDNPNPVRRRGHKETTRRRRTNGSLRLDFIFMAVVAVVAAVAVIMPQPPQQDPQLYQPQVTTQPTEPEEPTTLPTEPPTEPPTTEPIPVPLTFTAADEELIHVKTYCSGFADSEMVAEALEQSLEWDMLDGSFTVLIYHTHLSESYTQSPGEEYEFRGGDPYRTDDPNYNTAAIGERIAEVLRQHGINVIHETRSMEIPNSDYAYYEARDYLLSAVAENPDIKLVLDIHRDAFTNSDGSQANPTVTVDGVEAAQMSMLIGYPGSYDWIWSRNLAFATKLGAQMNKLYPDMFRMLAINYDDTYYNQDAGPLSMLVEVGTAGNTLDEALKCAECLALTLVDMAKGANIE